MTHTPIHVVFIVISGVLVTGEPLQFNSMAMDAMRWFLAPSDVRIVLVTEPKHPDSSYGAKTVLFGKGFDERSIIGCTTPMCIQRFESMPFGRGAAIIDWVLDNKTDKNIKGYVVVGPEDPDLVFHGDRLVVVDPKIGLQDTHVAQALGVLRVKPHQNL